ncbi:MAG: PIN domain-containing protein [Candidatus Zixiibacteriota bacterium]
MPYVTDTHALVWYMTDDPGLSDRAKRAFRRADNRDDYIVVPCIVFFELIILEEKGKLPPRLNDILSAIVTARNYRVQPLCIPVIQQCREFPRDTVPDPWAILPRRMLM